jgi:hypothetical protein
MRRKPSLLVIIGVTLIPLATSAICRQAVAQSTPREGTFAARWVVTGTWRGMALGEDREIILAELGGRLDVAADGGVITDFASRCLVFSDEVTGGIARCRWRHPSGDEAFSEIEGGILVAGGPVRGRFVGGTGRYVGLAGEFGFDSWSALYIERQDRTSEHYERGGRSIDGFVSELTGTWRLP